MANSIFQKLCFPDVYRAADVREKCLKWGQPCSCLHGRGARPILEEMSSVACMHLDSSAPEFRPLTERVYANI